MVNASSPCAAGYGFALSKEGGGWDNHASLTTGDSLILCPGDCPRLTQNLSQLPVQFNQNVCIDLSAYATSGTYIAPDCGGFRLQGGSSPWVPQSLAKQGGIKPQGPSPDSVDTPAWLAVGVPVTNAVNFVQFDARFSSTNTAEGLLTVYWNTNQIGLVDERFASPDLQSYRFALPGTVTNGLYTLSFRLDAFNNTSSSILVTNVATGFVGVTQPITLAASLSTNGAPVLRLAGAPGYNYLLQSSTNLADWKPAALLVNTNGMVSFVDPTITSFTKRFYRVVLP